MKAVRIYEFGSPEVLVVEDVPVPQVPPHGVLIRVKAAGIIFGDVLARKGVEQERAPKTLPYGPGAEVAGVIEAVGSEVAKFAPGQRVMARVADGGYAEFAVAAAGQVFPLPDDVPFDTALVYLVNLPAAHLVYHAFGAVRPKDTILLHAAAGGVGTLVTQIAKRIGENTVIALVSSDDKAAHSRANGADHVINYRTSDYVEEVLKITGGQGVDVCLNSVAGPTLQTDPYAIRNAGRWAIYGYAAGKGSIDPFKHFNRALTINVSASIGHAARPEFQQAGAALGEWLRTQPLDRPHQQFALDDVQAAHRWIEEQKSFGKVVLTVG